MAKLDALTTPEVVQEAQGEKSGVTMCEAVEAASASEKTESSPKHPKTIGKPWENHRKTIGKPAIPVFI